MVTKSSNYQIDLEEGEVSEGSNDCYNILRRPGTSLIHTSADMNMRRMDDTEEMLESDLNSEDSSSDSEAGVKRFTLEESDRQPKKVKKMKPMARYFGSQSTMKNLKLMKYNVWNETIQEESLMENMRNFDVTKIKKNDRNVESYDFRYKYQLNGENRLKRRLGSSTCNQSGEENNRDKKRSRNVKGRSERRSNMSRGSNYAPRNILSVDVDEQDTEEDIARDIANKLYEDKDVLLLRIVQVLGKKVAIELFKETQRVEMDGGMLIMNGKRRRTPGGVFLFLLKTDHKIEDEKKAAIFQEDVQKSVMERKLLQTLRRDQKVEELKKKLKLKDKKLKSFSCCPDTMTTFPLLNTEGKGALSNPPPSPVANTGIDNSPEYTPHAINHVNGFSPDKVSAGTSIDPEDDILDMNCDDMDML